MLQIDQASTKSLGSLAMRRFAKDQRVALTHAMKLTQTIGEMGDSRRTHALMSRLLTCIMGTYREVMGEDFLRDTNAAEAALIKKFNLKERDGHDEE